MPVTQIPTDQLQEKWKDILEHPDLPPITDPVKRATVATLIENTVDALATESDMNKRFLNESAPTNNISGGNIASYDPILISLIRRSMPNLIAYDICGVQPMTGPTGLIFAMRPRYGGQSGDQAFYLEANTGASARGASNTTAAAAGYSNTTAYSGSYDSNLGTVPSASNNVGNTTFDYAGGLNTATGEGLGSNTTAIFPEMSFTIDRVTVTAKERAMKAEYSLELAQDLRAVHGLDAETELANILAAEILADINREVLRAIVITAKQGAQDDTTTPGIYDLDVDANGRWMIEKFKGLHYQLDREANKIAKETRRGLGNIVICSSDVASALQNTGTLSNTPALNSNQLQVDDTGNTFVGVLNNKYRVYVDPYVSGGHYFVVGYKGASAYDSGIFYAPYVPLQKVRAVDPNTFQPKIGFKTRYGLVANPFAEGTTLGAGRLMQDSNVYYRRVIVTHLA